MLTELKLSPLLTDMQHNKTISIALDTVIYKDGIECARTRDRRAFAPGDIELVKEYTGLEESPEITYLNTIWDEQTIEDYLAGIAAQENQGA